MHHQCLSPCNFHKRPFLTFSGTFSKQITEHLQLTNTSSGPLAFKVKTTAPKLYCVRPNASIVKPGETVAIAIILQAFAQKLPTDYKCKDKFLVVLVPCPTSLDAANVPEQWAELESSQKLALTSQKLRVTYHIVDSDNTSLSAAPASHPDTTFDQTHNNTVFDEAETTAMAPKAAAMDTSVLHSAPDSTLDAGDVTAVVSKPVEFPAAAKSEEKSVEPSAMAKPQDKSSGGESVAKPLAKADESSTPEPRAPKPLRSMSPPLKRTGEPPSSEAVNGVSLPFAAILILLAFLLGWLAF